MEEGEELPLSESVISIPVEIEGKNELYIKKLQNNYNFNNK